MRRLIKAEGIVGVELHHVPSKASLDLAGIAIPPSKGPVIVQLVEDHRATRSWGSWQESKEFRQEVADLLARGEVERALRIEFGDLERIKGGAYGNGSEDVAKYIHDKLRKFKR